jgi:flagellar secretion chaperone FliS
MSYKRNNAAMAMYAEADIYSSANSADPHRLVEMLLEGAMSKVANASAFIARGRIADKCTQISQAIRIIEGLRLNLDREKGQTLAENLEQLYDYMSRLLLRANLDNDAEALNEVHALLAEIHAAWSAVKTQVSTQQKENKPLAGHTLQA